MTVIKKKERKIYYLDGLFWQCIFPQPHKPLLNGDVVTYILFALSGQIPDNQGSSEV